MESRIYPLDIPPLETAPSRARTRELRRHTLHLAFVPSLRVLPGPDITPDVVEALLAAGAGPPTRPTSTAAHRSPTRSSASARAHSKPANACQSGRKPPRAHGRPRATAPQAHITHTPDHRPGTRAILDIDRPQGRRHDSTEEPRPGGYEVLRPKGAPGVTPRNPYRQCALIAPKSSVSGAATTGTSPVAAGASSSGKLVNRSDTSRT